MTQENILIPSSEKSHIDMEIKQDLNYPDPSKKPVYSIKKKRHNVEIYNIERYRVLQISTLVELRFLVLL